MLYQHAIPHLYRSITIRARDEQDLTGLNFSIISEGGRNLTLVKDVLVTADFHRRLRNRCPGQGSYEIVGGSEDEEADNDPSSSELESNNETLGFDRGLQGRARALSKHDRFLAILES